MTITVPFVPTPYEVVKETLKIAGLKSNEYLLDLGCGDGRVLIIGAEDFGAKAVGIETRSDLVLKAALSVMRAHLTDRVLIIQGDFFKLNLSFADVVFMYLLSSVNEKLRPKLESELKTGARVVSHDFEVRGWKPASKHIVRDGYREHQIYLYVKGWSEQDEGGRSTR